VEVKKTRAGDKNLDQIFKELSATLNEKETKVIVGRFGLNGKKETLASIGKSLNLSRERVRQIENNAKQKTSLLFKRKFFALSAKIKEGFKSTGGILVSDFIPEYFLNLTDNHKFAKNYVRFFLTLIPDLELVRETDKLNDGWRLSNISLKQINSTIDNIVKFFSLEDIPQKFDDLYSEVVSNSKIEKDFVRSAILLSKKITIAKNGMIGLTAWPSVNPRNVRDKIYYVLKTSEKPLHFTEITSKIVEMQFDKKKVVRATIHNELTADSRFVLIGRGIYALREWGYSDGTVYEVIKNILSNSKKPMSTIEIVDLVNKSRKVRKNTIIINLQTKKEFKKVAGGYVYEGL